MAKPSPLPLSLSACLASGTATCRHPRQGTPTGYLGLFHVMICTKATRPRSKTSLFIFTKDKFSWFDAIVPLLICRQEIRAPRRALAKIEFPAPQQKNNSNTSNDSQNTNQEVKMRRVTAILLFQRSLPQTAQR